MTIRKAIYERYCEIRDSQGLTDSEVSRRCNVNRATICMLAHRAVGVRVMVGICEGLGVSIREFFDDDRFNYIDPE